jgi:hypothetical protein
MFKLFRKKQTSEPEVLGATVEQIHAEFDTAVERLLIDAEGELQKEVDIDLCDKLGSVGFGSSKNCQEAERPISAKYIKGKIIYYQQHYPSNKFITDDEIRRICQKYGLVFGDSHDYIGKIPERNAREIIAFVLRQEDHIKYECKEYKNQHWSGYGCDVYSRAIGHHYFKEVPRDQQFYYNRPSLMICAPKTDFRDKGMKVIDGYKIVQEDPVVLQPVSGGYLIISKWGPEASDESIVNQNMN